MGIDEGREQVGAGGIDRLDARGRGDVLADLGDFPVAHEHVEDLVVPGARVEHVGAGQEEVGGAARHAGDGHAGWGVGRWALDAGNGCGALTSSS